MPRSLHALRDGVRRHPHLDSASGRLLDQEGEEVLGQQPEVVRAGVALMEAGQRLPDIGRVGGAQAHGHARQYCLALPRYSTGLCRLVNLRNPARDAP